MLNTDRYNVSFGREKYRIKIRFDRRASAYDVGILIVYTNRACTNFTVCLTLICIGVVPSFFLRNKYFFFFYIILLQSLAYFFFSLLFLDSPLIDIIEIRRCETMRASFDKMAR